MRTEPIPLSSLHRHVKNARTNGEYRKADLTDLVASIRKHGLLQPLVVSKNGTGYTILAGHRRHAALKQLKAKEAPCIVLEKTDDQAALAVLLTENAQHHAVDPLKEAEAVAKLVGSLSEDPHPYGRASTLLGKPVTWVRARMRLTTLSPSWRKAFADPEHPVSQFPVGHLELVAALAEEVQEHAFADWESWWTEGVPLREDLRRMVAEFTRDLSGVPWDLDDYELLEDAPACSACPRRDSAQGDLFQGVVTRGLGGNGRPGTGRSDPCLDANCFQAKTRAAIYAAVEKARAKYGNTLRVETTFAHRNISMPEGLKVHTEHELTPLTKKKGGVPVLRLRTMKVAYLGKASRNVQESQGEGAVPLQASGKPKPKPLANRRQMLEKRRLVRALEVFRGSLLNRSVHVGTEKHPELLDPPEPKPPNLNVLLAFVLAYGTGPSVDPDADEYDGYPRSPVRFRTEPPPILWVWCPSASTACSNRGSSRRTAWATRSSPATVATPP